jgi:hypothetical protein
MVAVFTRAVDGKAIPELVADGSGLHLDLDGCFEKLGRAQEHLESIDELLRLFFDSDPYGATSEVEREHGWHVFKVEVRRQPPLRLGVIMGEYAHQVRSAFDHFAFALARAHLGKQPKAVIGFPMETSRTAYRKKAAHRLNRHIPHDWAAFIEALQPYDAHNDPLALLERFWNTDKHQTVVALPPAIVSSLFPSFYPHVAIKERRPRRGARLVDGTEVVRARPFDPQPHMDMYGEATVEIQSEGASSQDAFFWTLIPAESMLRMILSAFEAGCRPHNGTFGFSGRCYDTNITTLPGGTDEARKLGFLIRRDLPG